MQFNLLLHSERGWIVGFASKERTGAIAYFGGFTAEGEYVEVPTRDQATVFDSFDEAETFRLKLIASNFAPAV